MSTSATFVEIQQCINSGAIFSLSKEKLQQFVTALSQSQAFTHFGTSEFAAIRETVGRALDMKVKEEANLQANKGALIFEQILLQPEQKETLSFLVETSRNVPREKRRPFMFLRTMGGDVLMHPGVDKQWNGIYWGDIQELDHAHLLRLSYGSAGTPTFEVTPLGYQYYDWMKQQAGQPVNVIESEVRTYLNADSFRQKYPKAYEKWSNAESLLWGSDSEQQLTTIGHLCQEAVQEFATALVDKYQPQNVEKEVIKTVARLRAVIEKQESMGKDIKACLEALIVYWGTVNDLIQRQEHGGQKEGKPLVWEDGRRVVFHALFLMCETDRTLSSALQ